MLILGIETSCDETGAAVIEGKPNSKKVNLLSNVVASSLSLHSQSGGIIPENAAREQVKYIVPVIKEALSGAKKNIKDIDAIALTYGPGLIGSLLIGVETAKTLSYVFNKPLIPTNHLLGHIYANFIETELNSNIEFPAIALIVSGGHTDLILIKGHGSIKWLGGTRDDAAGEALDKIGRLLGLPYPGGPHIEKAAISGNSKHFLFPRPLIGSPDFDFSFSGLKTAVLREVKTIRKINERTKSDICVCVQNAIIDVLVRKTLRAVDQYNAKSILLGGGVAANQKLRDEFELKIENLKLKTPLFAPVKWLCTDNGAMIAAAAFFSAKGRSASGGNKIGVPWREVDANPSLYFN